LALPEIHGDFRQIPRLKSEFTDELGGWTLFNELDKIPAQNRRSRTSPEVGIHLSPPHALPRREALG
jgi:hypothetical protein